MKHFSLHLRLWFFHNLFGGYKTDLAMIYICMRPLFFLKDTAYLATLFFAINEIRP